MLIRPLLADELFLAYGHRVATENGLSGPAALRRLISKSVAKRPTDENPMARGTRWLVEISGLSTESVVKWHTLVPLVWHFAPAQGPQRILCTFGDGSYLSRANSLLADTARLCPDCVKEDRRFRGFTYWRRSHQVPGVDWCFKHNQILLENEAESPFSSSPESALKSGKCREPYAARVRRSSPYMQRFAAVVDLLLNNLDRPVDIVLARETIRRRAVELAKQMGIPAEARALPAIARREPDRYILPSPLATDMCGRPEVFIWHWFDHVSIDPRAAGPLPRIATLALLWDDPVDAVNAYRHGGTSLRQALTPLVRTG